MNHALGPLKGYWMLITHISESVDGLVHLAGVGGAQVPQNSSGQNAEPHLYLIQPGGMSGCVVEVDQGVAGQPTVVLALVSALTAASAVGRRSPLLRRSERCRRTVYTVTLAWSRAHVCPTSHRLLQPALLL